MCIRDNILPLLNLIACKYHKLYFLGYRKLSFPFLLFFILFRHFLSLLSFKFSKFVWWSSFNQLTVYFDNRLTLQSLNKNRLRDDLTDIDICFQSWVYWILEENYIFMLLLSRIARFLLSSLYFPSQLMILPKYNIIVWYKTCLLYTSRCV